jgi:TetR/AcrR family transcriptional regulator, transcriptional repressor for nem operon
MRDLLWERGYAATSPRAVLDRAGVGQGSMYHHFTGKEQLAVEALALTADEVFEQARATMAGPGSARDRVRAYLAREREVLRGCPVGRMAGDADVLGSESLRAVLATTFERIRGLVVSVLEEGVRAGEFAAGVHADDLAETVLAVVQGGYVLARAAGRVDPFDRAVRGAIVLLDAVGGGRAAS